VTSSIFNWISSLPIWAAVAVTGLGCAAGTGFFVAAFSPIASRLLKDDKDTRELFGYTLLAFGVFYALLVGLLTIATYSTFTSVRHMVGREASSLAALYRSVSGYPEDIRPLLQDDLREYTNFLIDEAWELQSRGIIATAGVPIMNRFQRKLTSFEPSTKGQEILHAETLRMFTENTLFRRERMRSVVSGLPSLMWFLVASGAGLLLLLVTCYRVRPGIQYFLGASIAFFLGIMILIISALDHPYRGVLKVDAGPFELVRQQLMQP
jgi:hypothetical protein